MPSKPLCPCEGRTLDKHLQPTILAFLAQGPEHGYKLVDRLSGSPVMNGRKPDRPGVYRSLVAMESQGLVKHVVTPSGSGPAKRLYQLTPTGQVCLGKWIATLQRYHEEIGELLSMMRDVNSRIEV